MIFTTDAKLVTLNDIDIGRLALGFGYGHQGVPFLISSEEQEKCLLRLRGEFFTIQDDGRTQLLDLGNSVVRFDVGSAIADDKAPDDGTLMITTDGPGVFENAHHFRARGGNLTLLTGVRKSFYRHREIPAFANWEIGFMREQDFVPVACINAHGNRFDR